MYTRTKTHTHILTHTHIHVYTYIHTYTHIYIYPQTYANNCFSLNCAKELLYCNKLHVTGELQDVHKIF